MGWFVVGSFVVVVIVVQGEGLIPPLAIQELKKKEEEIVHVRLDESSSAVVSFIP